MRRTLSALASLVLICVFVLSLIGCGADIKAENEKLKAENANLKTEIGKVKLDLQKLKDDSQKAAAEKDGTIKNLTDENEALKKQVETLKAAQVPAKKKK